MKILIFLLVLCLAGCDVPTGKKRSYDWDSCMGIHDVNSPNGELWHWMWDNETGANEIPADLLAAIKSNEQSELLFGRRNRFDESNTIFGVVDLSNYDIDSRTQQALISNRQVKWLHIGETTTAEDFEWLGKMHHLVGLRIANADFSGADFAKLKNLTEIRWLSIAWPKNLPDNFVNWPDFPKLETLDLEGDTIPDGIVSAFHRCSNLRSVHFGYSSIGDDGVKTLVNDHPNLEFLNLYRSEVTAESVDDLVRLKRMALLGIGLTALSPNVRYTDSVAKLVRELPRCTVDYGD